MAATLGTQAAQSREKCDVAIKGCKEFMASFRSEERRRVRHKKLFYRDTFSVCVCIRFMDVLHVRGQSISQLKFLPVS